MRRSHGGLPLATPGGEKAATKGARRRTSVVRASCAGLCVVGAATTGAWMVCNSQLSVAAPTEEAIECSVRVNTFRRNDLLAKFVAHYARCRCVGDITVVWSDLENEPPEFLVGSDKVAVERHSRDSLNNRFLALSAPAHAAVLSSDDDVFVSCRDLAAMLDAWRSSPRQMVGPVPRLVARHRGTFTYHTWLDVWWNGKYSLVLTKFALFHRDYLAAYAADALRPLRDHVDRHRNCEDLAMSFLVANATDAPPTWFRASYLDYGQYGRNGGISGAPDHIKVRANCLALFANTFRLDTLKTTSHKVIDARSYWFW